MWGSIKSAWETCLGNPKNFDDYRWGVHQWESLLGWGIGKLWRPSLRIRQKKTLTCWRIGKTLMASAENKNEKLQSSEELKSWGLHWRKREWESSYHANLKKRRNKPKLDRGYWSYKPYTTKHLGKNFSGKQNFLKATGVRPFLGSPLLLSYCVTNFKVTVNCKFFLKINFFI